MKIKCLLALLVGALLLQGCFFLYIPGKTVDAISDSITGAEGANCVRTNAQIGDKIKLPDGSTGTIKSLSGTSSRCKDEQFPIRALILPSIVGPTDVPPPYASSVRIELPAGWEQKPLTTDMTRGGGIVFSVNHTTDTGLLLMAIKRGAITDLSSYATSRRASQTSKLQDTQQSDIEQLGVRGRKAWRFEVTGNAKGQKLTYMMTIVEGATEVAVLNAWTSATNFLTQKDAMERLADGIGGL